MKKTAHSEHIGKKTLRALIDGALDNALTVAAADHIAQCGVCAEQLALEIEAIAVNPPRGFAELAMEKINVETAKKRKDFYIYCVKVAACAAAVIALTLSSIIPQTISMPDTQNKFESQRNEAHEHGERPTLFDKLSGYLVTFKNSITQSEENPNDKTEK